MIFKEGDIVVVHKRCLVNNSTDGLYWNPIMDKYDGNEFEIIKVLSSKFVHLRGAVKGGGGRWIFHTDWLEPVNDNEELDCGDFTALISNI